MKPLDETKPENQLTGEIMDCLFQVHKALGPGLIESLYEDCFCYELDKRSIGFERQKHIPVYYDGVLVRSSGLRLDVLVEDMVIIELKSVENLMPVHKAQILSYLRLAHKPIGFLVNFNVPLIKDGVRRFINKL